MRRLFLVVLSMSFMFVLHAQTVNAITERVISQLKVYPQEKTYTHTDAADYAPGDRMWLKVYVVGALSHEPQSESLYAYVELTAPDGTLTARAKLLCRDGIYAGYLDIPPSADGGCYWLRSYTERSKNAPMYTSAQPIYIGGRPKLYSTHQQDGIHVASNHGDSLLSIARQHNKIIVTTSADDDSLMLLAHCRAYPFAMSGISKKHPVVLDVDSMPQGVVALLLVNKQQKVLSERLLMSDNGREQCRIDIVSDKATYTPASTMKLTLLPHDLHEGERADVSISITGTSISKRHRPSSILAHLMIASDVDGGVDSPEQYLGRPEKADSMLALHRWKRYDFNRVLHADYELPRYGLETTHTISGRVRTLLRRRPVRGAQISLISPQAGCYATAVSDSDGCFVIPGMDFTEGTQYVLRATDANGKEHMELTVNEPVRPDFPIHVASSEQYDGTEVMADSLLAFNPDGIMLDDVEVTTRIRNSASTGNVYAQLADFSFGLHRIEEIGATCLHELIRHIPGVRLHDNKCYVRGTTSIYGDTPAAIAIDGVIVADEYDLDNIQMQDVARVDVFKTGTTVIWGAAGGSGVISITTKTGTYGDEDKERFNQKKVTPLGYQRQEKFFDQAGHRKTLYWNPHVTSEDIELNADVAPGICHVVVEGVTTEGRLIHEESNIIVKP